MLSISIVVNRVLRYTIRFGNHEHLDCQRTAKTQLNLGPSRADRKHPGLVNFRHDHERRQALSKSIAGGIHGRAILETLLAVRK